MTEGLVVLLAWGEFLLFIALLMYFVLWRRDSRGGTDDESGKVVSDDGEDL